MVYGRLSITQPEFRYFEIRDRLRIGSAANNEVVLDASDALDLHAEISYDHGSCRLFDLSGGQILIDGAPIGDQNPLPLTKPCRINIGKVTLRFLPGAGNQPGQAAAPARSQPGVTPLINQQPTVPLNPQAAATAATTPHAETPKPISERLAVRPSCISIKVSPPEQIADVGRPVVLRAEVRNDADPSVDPVATIDLRVEGIDKKWVKKYEQAFTLYPGDRRTVDITIIPPPDPSSNAGDHPVTLVAQSRQRSSDTAAATVTVTVNRFTSFDATIQPELLRGWLWGSSTLTITNDSNWSPEFQLEGRDDEGILRFSFAPRAPVLVEPGGELRIRTRVRLPAARLIGKDLSYPLHYTVAPRSGSADKKHLNAELIQTPPMPPWALALTFVALLLSCIAFSFAYALPFLRNTAAPAVAKAIYGPSQTPTLGPTAGITPEVTPPTAEPVLVTVGVLQTVVVTAVVKETTEATVIISATPEPTAVPTETFTPEPPTLTLTPEPPTLTPTPSPTIGPDRVFGFSTLNNNPVSQRTRIRGNEYAALDAFFCFYINDQLLSNDVITNTDHMKVVSAPESLVVDQPLTVVVEVRAPIPGPVAFTVPVVAQQPGTVVPTSVPAPPTATPTSLPNLTNVEVSAQIPPHVSDIAIKSDQASAICRVEGERAICSLPAMLAGATAKFTLTMVPRLPGYIQQNIELKAKEIVKEDGTADIERVTPITRVAAVDLFDCGFRQLIDVGREVSLEREVFQIAPVVYPAHSARDAPLHALTADAGAGQFIDGIMGMINFNRDVAHVDIAFWYPSNTGTIYTIIAIDAGGREIGRVTTGALAVVDTYTLSVSQQPGRPIRRVMIAPGFGTQQPNNSVYITNVSFSFVK